MTKVERKERDYKDYCKFMDMAIEAKDNKKQHKAHPEVYEKLLIMFLCLEEKHSDFRIRLKKELDEKEKEMV